MIRRYTAAIFAVVGTLTIAACGAGSGGVGVTSVGNPGNPGYSSLQFAVGTARLYSAGEPIGLNVVSTFRQTNGDSATGVNTPTINGPFTITAPAVGSYGDACGSCGFPDPYTTVFNGGPSVREVGRGTIFGTPQTIAAGTPACDGPGPYQSGKGFVKCPSGLKPNTSTLGQSGGVFAIGLQPSNAVASTGQAYSYQPYPQPMFQDAISVKPTPVPSSTATPAPYTYQFVPWGGPPAFDPFQDKLGLRDGVNGFLGVDSFGDPYFLGIGEGVTAFAGVTPRDGVYSMNVAIATIGSGGTTVNNVSKTAHLNRAHVLPVISAPIFKPDGKGGGDFTTSLSGGMTEAFVQIVDWGPGGGPNNGAAGTPPNCQGARGTSFAPVYYTIVVRNHAPTTYHLADTIGPNLSTSGGKGNIVPSPTVCTAAQNGKHLGGTHPGDDIVVQMIGFDYPAYEAANSLTVQNVPQNPAITGPAGQADVTISFAEEQDNGGTTQQPALTWPHRYVAHRRRIFR